MTYCPNFKMSTTSCSDWIFLKCFPKLTRKILFFQTNTISQMDDVGAVTGTISKLELGNSSKRVHNVFTQMSTYQTYKFRWHELSKTL